MDKPQVPTTAVLEVVTRQRNTVMDENARLLAFAEDLMAQRDALAERLRAIEGAQPVDSDAAGGR
ncbi:hypothetical protein [Streptosporangium longisporum]|uniref:Uncharacterized protein n=1 Tax=Streptosporangium longisporum TaxID=46187 RepID=A0ABP6LGM0_9ACTN